jgi:cell division protein FtsL
MDGLLTLLMCLCVGAGLIVGGLAALIWAEYQRRQMVAEYEFMVSEAIDIGMAWKAEAIKLGYNQG